MSKRTRRDFLKITGSSVAAVTLAQVLPTSIFALVSESTPGDSIDVRVTAGEKRYAAAAPLRWPSKSAGGGTNTIAISTLDDPNTQEGLVRNLQGLSSRVVR